jgi:two-component sensor histidine kinase
MTMSAELLAQDSFVAGIEPRALLEEITRRIIDEYSNAIASLNVVVQRTADGQTRSTVAGVAGRLRSRAEARMPVRPPPNDGLVDLGDYLEPMCADLTKDLLEEEGVRLVLVHTPVLLDRDRCWRVGLIISELVQNAARGGFRDPSGVILVDFSEQAGEIMCCVSDNGDRPSAGPPDRDGALVKGLAAELGGFVSWRCSYRSRAATLTFPQTPPAAIRGRRSRRWMETN